jgi:hypothetical protein
MQRRKGAKTQRIQVTLQLAFFAPLRDAVFIVAFG